MKAVLNSLCIAMLLVSCGDSDSISVFQREDTLKWTTEPAGTLEVRGQSYDVVKSTGRDLVSGEIFVVEYSTMVDGRRARCVGDISGCPAAIERKLDKKGGRD